MTDERPESTASRGGSATYVFLVCIVAALGGLLFGYDTGVISGAIGPLVERFDLSPKMEGWAASCALVGCMFGAGFAGTISDRIGRKKVLVVSAVLFLVSAVGTALPRNLVEFIIFRFIGGLGVGAASMTSPMYIAEITPARIRGRMVSVNQFAIVSGFLVVYFVNYYIALGRSEEWIAQTGWR
ncbi:MAG: MFS transporter, partial [Planctomycetota bacterium]